MYCTSTSGITVCLPVCIFLSVLLFFSHLAMLWRWSTQYKQHLSGRIITSIIVPQRVNRWRTDFSSPFFF